MKPEKAICSLFIGIIVLSAAILNAGVVQEDSLALVALYNSADGDNWTNNDNWLTGSVDTWFGITVENNRVDRIILSENNLKGTLPADIGNLTAISRLTLDDNKLNGSIPPEIGNLTKLKGLHLQRNELNGTIPDEIGNLTELTTFFLYGNQLTGTIPPEIGNLDKLVNLLLSRNQFSGSIPPEIGNLTNVSRLHLSDNQLTGKIPSEIGNLSRIIYLHLNDNSLSGPIPIEIGNFPRLTLLQLSSNSLSDTIPSEIGNLPKLETLNLTHNQLSGQIPVEFGNLDSLHRLYLSDNQLTGKVPDQLNRVLNLERIVLDNNELTQMPDLSGLDLEKLHIRNNKFTFGDIEPNMGAEDYKYAPQDSVGVRRDTTVKAYSRLELSVSVDGEHNLYQWYRNGGPIAGATDPLLMLDPVTQSDSGQYICGITNSVATELTLYSRPVNLNIEENKQRSDSLALVALYDSTKGDKWINNDNWLSGPVESWYGITVSENRVSRISLKENNLNGELPSALSKLTKLSVLSLNNNQLKGAIPDDWKMLENLLQLILYNNQLNELPDLSTLTNLSSLFIQNNRFTFEDIEPNIGIKFFTYAPQDSVGTRKDTTVSAGARLEFSAEIGGTANQYQWYKDAVEIEGAQDSVYTIGSASESDAGEYICHITSDIVADLTLYSRPVTVRVSTESGIAESEQMPLDFALRQNYPNPFNAVTTIPFTAPRVGQVSITVYDMNGRKVQTLLNKTVDVGHHIVKWNGTDASGELVGSGVYFIRMQTETFKQVQKVILMK